MDGGRPGSANSDAVQRRRRPQRCRLSGISLRLWRGCRCRIALPVQCHGAQGRARPGAAGHPGDALPGQWPGREVRYVPPRDGATGCRCAHAHAAWLGWAACDRAIEGQEPAPAQAGVERPFRTVKEAHETLYHFHTPQNEAEANLWLRNYLVRYNAQPHRSEPRSRTEDWLSTLPETGLRAMCTWDRFRTFAREPERRRVGIDARVQVDGISYEVDPRWPARR